MAGSQAHFDIPVANSIGVGHDLDAFRLEDFLHVEQVVQQPAPAIPQTQLALQSSASTGIVQDAASHKDPKRRVHSCSTCRRRKIRCSRTIPCEACIQRGEAADCKPVEAIPHKGYYVSLVEHEALKRRVVLLENRLNVPNPPSAGSAQPMEHSPSKSGQSPIRYTDVGSSPGQASLDEATEELDAALLLDTLALGSKTGRQQFVYDQQHRSNGSHLNRRSRDGSTGQPTRVTGPLSFFLGLNFDYLAAASAALPSSEVQQRLIQHYRDNVDWQLRAVDFKVFLDDLSNASRAGQQIPPHILSILFMVLCLAAAMLDAPHAAEIGWSHLDAGNKARTWFEAAQAVMWTADFLNDHRLAYLQSIVLTATYRLSNRTDESDSHWALTGSAVKIAQSLGIHKLGEEGKETSWPAMWASRRDREAARRTWYNLMSLDYTFSTANGSTYAIHPSQNACALPSNIDMAELDTDLPTRHTSEYTDYTFQRFRAQILMLMREVIDERATSGIANVAFTEEMYNRLEALGATRPSCMKLHSSLDLSLNKNLIRETLLLELLLQHRILWLNRPYLMKGHKPGPYSSLKDRCQAAGRSTLQTVYTIVELAPDLLKFWTTIYFIFSAAVVTFWKLTQETDPTKQAELRILLRATLETFRTQAATSTAADKALTLLNGLLYAEEEVRRMSHSTGHAARKRPFGALPAESWKDPLLQLASRLAPDVAGEDRSDTATGSTRGQTTKIPKLNAVENSAPEHNSSGPHLDLDLFASGQMDGVNFPLDNPAGMAQTEDVLDYYDMLFRGGIPAGFSDSEDNLLPYEPSGSLSTD